MFPRQCQCKIPLRWRSKSTTCFLGQRPISEATTSRQSSLYTHESIPVGETKQLQPVPRIRDALFQLDGRASDFASLHRMSRNLDGMLLDHSDALRLCSTPWSRLTSGSHSPAPSSFGFNALIARLQKLSITIPPSNVLIAVKSAVGNPEAMKQYLVMLEKALAGNRQSCENDKQMFTQIGEMILQKNQNASFSGWLGERKRLQWLEVITGWKNGVPRQSKGRREFCLYHLAPEAGEQWSLYLDLVQKFGDADVVYEEWARFTEMKQLKQSPEIDSARTKELSSSIKTVKNLIIRTLLKLDDPKCAWRVAYESGDLAATIDDDTMALLLAHPQHAKAWAPEMNGPALTMLLRELKALESKLGFRWEGGEDGFHRGIPTRKPMLLTTLRADA